MSPVNRRGRRRLDPEAPVERLRGLLEHDAAHPEGNDDHEPVASEETTVWRPPVRWKVPWAAVLLAVVALGAVGISWVWPDDQNSGAVEVSASIGPEPSGSASAAVEAGATSPPGDVAAEVADTVFVHVVGEVHRPGVVEIRTNGRVQDAVEAAGGLTDQAVVTHVNLAAPVTDGAQVVIPDTDGDRDLAGSQPATVMPGQTSTAGAVVSPGAEAEAGTGAGTGAAGTPSDPAAGAAASSVNLNTATAAELETLPRVGPVMAQRILDHRDQVGGFRSVEELDDVTGIGPAMLAALTPLVTV